jgi:hypothetical protein
MNCKDPVTTFAYNLISLHHDIMWYIIIILTLVYWSLYKILKEYSWNTFKFNNKRNLLMLMQLKWANKFEININGQCIRSIIQITKFKALWTENKLKLSTTLIMVIGKKYINYKKMYMHLINNLWNILYKNVIILTFFNYLLSIILIIFFLGLNQKI